MKKLQRSLLLSLGLLVAVFTAVPMTAAADHDPPVTVAVGAAACAEDGSASLTLTLTNHLFTESGEPTLFASEYWVDGDPGILNVWSAQPDEGPIRVVGVGSVDVEFRRTFVYQLTKGTESDYFVEQQTVKNPCVPSERTDCQWGGYANYGFESQRDCFAFLRTGVDPR